MTTLPTVSEAGEEEASLHPSFTTHPAGETSHTNRPVWVTPQSTTRDQGSYNSVQQPTMCSSTKYPPAPPRLYSNQAMTYTERLSITTLENSQPIDLYIGNDTRSSTVTSQSHTVIGNTQNPVVRTTNLLHPLGCANQPSLDSAPLDRARVDEESDSLTSQPLLTPVVNPSAYTAMLEESTTSETSPLEVGTGPLSIVGSKFTEITVGNAAVDICFETPSDSSDSPQDSTFQHPLVKLAIT